MLSRDKVAGVAVAGIEAAKGADVGGDAVVDKIRRGRKVVHDSLVVLLVQQSGLEIHSGHLCIGTG